VNAVSIGDRVRHKWHFPGEIGTIMDVMENGYVHVSWDDATYACLDPKHLIATNDNREDARRVA
jgi:hypothetical protein